MLGSHLRKGEGKKEAYKQNEGCLSLPPRPFPPPPIEATAARAIPEPLNTWSHRAKR